MTAVRWTEPRIRALAAFHFDGSARISNETVVDPDGRGLVCWRTAAWLVKHGYALRGFGLAPLHLTYLGVYALMVHDAAGRLEPYGIPRLHRATLEPS